jgi:chromosome segregation ATPase
MMSPFSRSGGNRRNTNRSTPAGMTVVSPGDSVSPLDARMTPIRRSLFQKRRTTSSKRIPETAIHIEEDSMDDTNEKENLGSTKKKKKDGKLKVLHDRFTHIQNGLGSIDEERNHLVEKARKLDKEKKFIQKQLELREKEILSLIKRCASQEEKVRESSKLRSSNRDLQEHLNLMTQRLQGIEGNQQDRNSLKKMLQDSELEREHLKDRLAKVQRDHDSIADTLQECLGNIRILTEEKHAIEEDRRRERRRAEIELEKQRLVHVNDSNCLKEDINSHQNRIHQMENILQENMKSNTALRREKAMMSQGQEDEIQEVVQEYEQQLLELRTEINETTRGKKKEHEHGVRDLEEEIVFMKDKLKSKDDKIEELQTEFAGQMVELMSKQSNLDEAEEGKKILELKVESMKNLEIEHAAMLDFVQILDSNLADLTAENANLELEKDTLCDETDELRKKTKILQSQFSSLQNNHKAKESDFRELLNAEKGELQIELEDSLRSSRLEVVSLQDELENRNKCISKLENELNVARKSIVEKEEEIIRFMSEMDSLRSDLGTELRKARIEVAQFEAEVFAKDQNLASLEGRLEGAQETRDTEEKINKEESMIVEDEIDSTTTNENEDHKENLSDCDSVSSTNDSQSLQQLHSPMTKLEERIRMLDKELSEAQISRSESVAHLEKAYGRIEDLESQVIGKDERTVSLESQLQEATHALFEKESKACSMEKEYSSNTQLLIEREHFNKEACSKISELEDKITAMNDRSKDLDIQVKEYNREKAEKDEIISSLQMEVVKGGEERSTLLSKLDQNNDNNNNNQDLQMEIENTKTWLSSKEKRIEELENLVSNNKFNLQSLEDSLSKANSAIEQLEETIRCQEQEKMVLTEQLREANETIININKNADDDTKMKSLEHKIHSLLSSQTDLTTELNKANAILEKERKGWISSEEMFDQERSVFKAELSKFQEVVTERDILKSILSNESKCEELTIDLEDKVRLLDEKLQTREDSLLKVNVELETVKAESQEKGKVIDSLRSSIESLQEVVEKTEKEISEQNYVVATLEKSAKNLKSDLANTQEDITAKDNKIKSLEDSFKSEVVSRMNLVGEISAAKEHMSESQRVKEELVKELEEIKQENFPFEDLLSETKNALEALDNSSRVKIAKLEDQITKITTDLALRDDEIRELRLVELNDAEEIAASLTEEVNFLKEEVRVLSLEKESEILQQEKEADSMAKSINSLKKKFLESRLSELTVIIDERDTTIHELKEAALRGELALEKEQTERHNTEEKNSKEQTDLEETRNDLKKALDEFRKKESVLESKLEEERGNKEYAEESLKIVKAKYNEVVKTKRNVTDLERENGELKDKIRRQETYLQKKLQKEKAVRARLTPTKSIVSPSKSITRTPLSHRNANISSRALPPASSRSKLRAPSTIGRGISTGKSIASPSVASCRSAKSTRSSKFFTPTKKVQALSPREKFQSDTDDRSAASELYSILRTPNKGATAIPAWELE